MSGSPDVDAYIAKAAPFAQPILMHLRALVHAACPDVSESLKWGMPAFSAQGHPIATMAAHKAHASFGFWNGDVVAERREGGMGQFGRITSLADLPDDEAIKIMVREAVAAAQRPRGSKPTAAAKDVPVTPPDLAAALGDHIARFDAMPPSHRREYVEWIEDAKRPDTRAKRIAQAAEWIAEGKSRNWKYERR